MKKLLCTILALVLAFSCAAALAEGNDAKVQKVRGNASFTPDSYPEVVITPVFDDYIITGYNPEKYPAKFLKFAPPEGGALLQFRPDMSSFVNFDTLAQVTYYCYDRMAFELFLEKAEADNILSDGADGAAIYVRPDDRRGCAMIDLKEQFGGTAKLEIEVYDHTGDLKKDELSQLIQDEVSRVRGGMQLVDGDGYWSANQYGAIELYDDHNEAGLTVDASGWTVTDLDLCNLVSKVKGEGDTDTLKTKIGIGGYVPDDGVDAKLADGTEYKLKAGEYTSRAYFYLQEGKYSGQVYLGIEIDGPEGQFAQALEDVYRRITLNLE